MHVWRVLPIDPPTCEVADRLACQTCPPPHACMTGSKPQRRGPGRPRRQARADIIEPSDGSGAGPPAALTRTKTDMYSSRPCEVAFLVARGQRLGVPAYRVRWKYKGTSTLLPEAADTYELEAGLLAHPDRDQLLEDLQKRQKQADEVRYIYRSPQSVSRLITSTRVGTCRSVSGNC